MVLLKDLVFQVKDMNIEVMNDCALVNENNNETSNVQMATAFHANSCRLQKQVHRDQWRYIHVILPTTATLCSQH